MEPTVRDVMTTPVVSVKKDASFRAMAAALRNYRVSAFPVIDDDEKVIGVVEGEVIAGGFEREMVRRVRQVPGVVAVHDHLTRLPEAVGS